MWRHLSAARHAAVALAFVLGACADNTGKRGDLSGTFAISPTRKVYIECRGNGSPTVVLDPNLCVEAELDLTSGPARLP